MALKISVRWLSSKCVNKTLFSIDFDSDAIVFSSLGTTWARSKEAIQSQVKHKTVYLFNIIGSIFLAVRFSGNSATPSPCGDSGKRRQVLISFRIGRHWRFGLRVQLGFLQNKQIINLEEIDWLARLQTYANTKWENISSEKNTLKVL